MRRSALLGLAALLAARAAAADDDPRATFGLPPKPAAPPADPVPGDPRDVFGLGRRPVEPPPSCDDSTVFGCATATDPFDDASPYGLHTWLSAAYLLRLPVGAARHDAVATFANAAGRDEAGPSFAGATGLENTWTIEGAPAESLRTGNVETRVPLTFLRGLRVTAGGFAARDRAATGGAIDARLIDGAPAHAVEAHAWLTLTEGIGRTRPIPSASYQLRRLAIDPQGDVSASVVARGPLPGVAGGRAWYAAGVAPTVGRSDVRWRTGTITDRDDNGLPDGLPGDVITAPLADRSEPITDYLVAALARAGWTRGRHTLELTLVGNAVGDSVFFSNATQQAAGTDRRFWLGDAIASWRGRWRDTRAQVRLSWHHSTRLESAHDPAAANIPQFQSAYVPTSLPEEPALAAACADSSTPGMGDPFPRLENCPIPFGFFISGGAGLLTDSSADRPQASADVAHRRGAHVIRAGALLEDSRLRNTARFTGGELVRSLFDAHRDHQRFYDGPCPEDPSLPCAYTDRSILTYRTRYAAAYAEDTITLAPGLRANAGLRWELLWVGPFLHLSNEPAPRLGLAWDVLGGGASRLFASLGRTHLMLPPGVGPTMIRRPRTVRDTESELDPTRRTDPGGVFPVSSGIKPGAQDEATVGFEVGRARTARATIWLQARTLRRAIDTVLLDPDTFDLIVDNPGRRHGMVRAARDSTTAAVELATDPAAATTLRASYQYNRTSGTWTGPIDPRQGAVLYASSDWDFETANYQGLLPTDGGHRLAIEAAHRGRPGTVQLSGSARLTLASGRPRNVLADDGFGGVYYLLPRGSDGRSAQVAQVNARLAARWRGFDLTLDVQNVFDRQTATNLDEIYAGANATPIIGGTEQDLVFLKTDTGGTPVRRTAFRLPFAFQPPLAASLGIHRAF